MASKTEHTGFRNGDLFCFNCGTSQKLPFPIEIKLAYEWMNGFAKVHKSCKKTWKEPVNDVVGKSEQENAGWWVEFGEHGMSSKTMFNALSDDHTVQNKYPSTPSDPDDFRRCYLLIKAVPQFKGKLYRVAKISDTWDKIVTNWDKLSAMLEEQMETKKANGMYEFMKSIGC